MRERLAEGYAKAEMKALRIARLGSRISKGDMDMLGVTSIVRALNFNVRYHNALVDHFHSVAVKLDQLTALLTQPVLHLVRRPLRINGRLVLVGDHIKIPNCGHKMPAVKRLHRQSDVQYEA